MRTLMIFTILFISVGSISHAQINVGGIGGSLKNKAKTKVDKKKDKVVKEATRDPKDPPTPSEPLYDPYMRVRKYISQLDNLAQGQADFVVRKKKQEGTEEDQEVPLKYVESKIKDRNEKLEYFNKHYKQAEDSLAAFNKYNTANKKGKPRYITTFKEDLEAAKTKYETANKYFMDELNERLALKKEIDKTLTRKNEIEALIADSMGEDLQYIFKSYLEHNKDLHKYGEEYFTAAQRIDWKQLDQLLEEWKKLVATGYRPYKGEKYNEHILTGIERRKVERSFATVEEDKDKYLETYKEWSEKHTSENMKYTVKELMFTSKNNYPDNNNNQWVDAREALYFAKGAVIMFPDNAELKSSKQEAQSFYDELWKRLPGGPFQKEHYLEVVFFNKKITPGQETQNNVSSSWKFGQTLTGMFYFMDAADYFYRYDEEEEGMYGISFDADFGKREVNIKGLYIPLVSRKERKAPYVYFDMFPNLESIKGYYGADLERYFKQLKELPVGRYKVHLERNYDDLAQRKMTTPSPYDLELEITQEAIDYFNKAYEKAKKERMNLVRVGKAGMTDAGAVAAVKKGYADKKGKVLRVVITSKRWNLNKNSLDIPKDKWVSVDVVYKDENGQCWLHKGGTVQREYNGTGYDSPYYRHVYNEYDMLCGNAMK